MIYDYIIVGSGVAGNVCAYILAQKGNTCLILEKNKQRQEKICGGGIPFKALKLLEEKGMNLQAFLKQDISLIDGDVTFNLQEREEDTYPTDQLAVGSQRRIFDDFLLEQAKLKGVKVDFGEIVSQIEYTDEIYNVNYYKAKNIVIAAGAKGLAQGYTKGQSMGISAQVIGKSNLNPNKFYYWYYTGRMDKYFWIFPVGHNRWNVGLWYREPNKEMKRDFSKCWKNIFEKYFNEGYIYVQKPIAEPLGNIDLRNKIPLTHNGLGDFAGCNNIKNGGGIYRAIKSAIQFCNQEDNKS